MPSDLWSRGIDDDIQSVQTYSNDESQILQIVSVTFSSVNIIAAVLTLYGFYVMRRRFRQELVMTLIISGMFKAFWYWLYAVVILIRGQIQSSSVFCQLTGFFVSIGTEASDIALLMIAIHTTVFVFYPPTSLGVGGLYPYRHIVIAIWSLTPILLAGLAFTNSSGAYYAGAISCSLPVRPFWYSLALSWIPRYVILVAILIMNASVYFYVRYKFGKLKDAIQKSRKIRPRSSKPRETGGVLVKAARRHSNPPTPPLVYNGLLSETRRSSCGSVTNPTGYPLEVLPTATIQKWTIRCLPRRILRRCRMGLPTTSDFETHVTGSPEAAVRTPASAPSPYTPASWTSFISQFRPRQSSMHSFRSFLRRAHHSSSPITPSTPFSQIDLNARDQNLHSLSGLEAHAKVGNLLRFLFVYPTAYLCLWIVPFAAHLIQYSDNYVLNLPFGLSTCVCVILSNQCLLDCLLFSWREKPWRQPIENRKTLAQRWADLKDWRNGRRTSSRMTTRVGKSKMAMVYEAKLAYRRRDIEMSEATANSANRARRGERSWWEELEEVDESVDSLYEPVVSPPTMRGALMDARTADPVGKIADIEGNLRS